jgi:hypothetical protein
MNLRIRLTLVHLALLLAATIFVSPAAQAQETQEVDPAAALASALIAACRQNETQFARYLTAENAAAFRALPEGERTDFLHRFSLLDGPGRALVSNDAQNHSVVRCDGSGASVEFRLGAERVRENLAFIPVRVADNRSTEFGLVREGGGWRILSLGLLLINVPELAKQWAAQDLEAREAAAIKTLLALADAIDTYRRAFEKLPESLEQLGPAPKEGISPDAANLVDAQLAAGTHVGYRFRYRIVPAPEGSESKFELAASPMEYGKSGRRSFFLDVEGKLHGADHQGAVATAEDPVISSEKSE